MSGVWTWLLPVAVQHISSHHENSSQEYMNGQILKDVILFDIDSAMIQIQILSK